jgi:osmotically-inducible protein OsmY
VIGWFHASASDGVVTLSGPEDEEPRRLAARTARSVPGVMSVRFAQPAPASA